MESYRPVLVHMDASPRCSVRLGLGRQLAREHDAAALLAMLAPEPRAVPEPLPLDMGVPVFRSEVIPEHRRRARQRPAGDGCHGHHRLLELLLGGTTLTVLRSMTLPVLLAH